MKKCITLFLAITMCFLSGCAYIAHKEYYRKIEDYQEILELPGYWQSYDEEFPIFPERIDDLSVSKIYCRYDQLYPLGETIQIFLQIQYDDNSFDAELERIAENSVKNDKDFTNDQFFAYTVHLGEDDCWEYALVDETQKNVYYIFIYDVPEKEIEINKSFLPNNYTNDW